MTKLAFVDTETTGLDSDRHEIWELAIITADHLEHDHSLRRLRTQVYAFQPNPAEADPMALTVGKYYERTASTDWRWQTASKYADGIARLLDGCHLVGAVPDFDARFLKRYLNRHEAQATWHYHLIDVENLMVGWLSARSGNVGVTPPWKSDELGEAIGVTPDPETKHTALGDAVWALRCYEKVMGLAPAELPA